MGKEKKPSSLFDDDFEVTYEEEIPVSYSFDTKKQPNSAPMENRCSFDTLVFHNGKSMVNGKNPGLNIADDEDDIFDTTYFEYNDYREEAPENDAFGDDVYRDDTFEDDVYRDDTFEDDVYRDDAFEDDAYDDDVYRDDTYEDDVYRDDTFEDNVYRDEDYDSNVYRDEGYRNGAFEDDVYDNDYPRDPKRWSKKARAHSSPRLSSPGKSAAKYGTKAIYQFARLVVRVVSILITAGTLCVVAYNFWRGAAPYGDPRTILTEKNLTLAAYAATAALFVLYELAAFFWSLTKMRVRDGRKVYKEDTGRGLFSFIFIYIASYLSFLLTSLLPEKLGSFALLNGARGALEVFGSLHNVLLGLCVAGAVSCLVRRKMN